MASLVNNEFKSENNFRRSTLFSLSFASNDRLTASFVLHLLDTISNAELKSQDVQAPVAAVLLKRCPNQINVVCKAITGLCVACAAVIHIYSNVMPRKTDGKWKEGALDVVASRELPESVSTKSAQKVSCVEIAL